MQIFNAILTDRGSKYSVSGAPVKTKKEALMIIKALKKNKKYAKSSLNTWAAVPREEGPILQVDVRSDRGRVILHQVARADRVCSSAA